MIAPIFSTGFTVLEPTNADGLLLVTPGRSSRSEESAGRFTGGVFDLGSVGFCAWKDERPSNFLYGSNRFGASSMSRLLKGGLVEPMSPNRDPGLSGLFPDDVHSGLWAGTLLFSYRFLGNGLTERGRILDGPL